MSSCSMNALRQSTRLLQLWCPLQGSSDCIYPSGFPSDGQTDTLKPTDNHSGQLTREVTTPPSILGYNSRRQNVSGLGGEGKDLSSVSVRVLSYTRDPFCQEIWVPWPSVLYRQRPLILGSNRPSHFQDIAGPWSLGRAPRQRFPTRSYLPPVVAEAEARRELSRAENCQARGSYAAGYDKDPVSLEWARLYNIIF